MRCDEPEPGVALVDEHDGRRVGVVRRPAAVRGPERGPAGRPVDGDLRLDARLVTSELQTRWLQREKQARMEQRAVDAALGELLPMGATLRAAGGEA